MQVQNIITTSYDDQQRLDNFLVKKLKKVPKSHIYKLIRSGQVRVNKKRAKPFQKLNQGDVVRIPPVSFSENEEVQYNSSKKLEIIHDDKHLIVVNKPSGMAVHGGSGHSYGVIENLRSEFANNDLQLAHRIDRDTSGCIIICKTRTALLDIHEKFRDRNIFKQYIAIVENVAASGTIKSNIAVKRDNEGERYSYDSEDGKPSKSIVKVLYSNKQFSLVLVRIITGRMHQIRMQLSNLGNPIIGDIKYGSKHKGFNLMLHSYQMQFECKGKDYDLKAKIPNKFLKALDFCKLSLLKLR
jgi:23S rRNA pseudouridine955/2504/2580 synthase